jgi:hypothetical protein
MYDSIGLDKCLILFVKLGFFLLVLFFYGWWAWLNLLTSKLLYERDIIPDEIVIFRFFLTMIGFLTTTEKAVLMNVFNPGISLGKEISPDFLFELLLRHYAS